MYLGEITTNLVRNIREVAVRVFILTESLFGFLEVEMITLRIN